MTEVMKPTLMTQMKPSRWASPGKPISELPLYWVA